MESKKEETEPIPRQMTTGRKVFNGLAIVTLVIFTLFTLALTIGTILIPAIRGDAP